MSTAADGDGQRQRRIVSSADAMGERATSHQSEPGQWEMVSGAPHPSLRSYVRRYIGWHEHFAVPI